jgi:alpha-L-fucosidase
MPTVREVRAHEVPRWWRDAKLGIFVHWTPASVPGFAPTTAEIGDLLASRDPEAMAHSPYTEWYENSIRFPGSSAAEHHEQVHGDAPYRDFARTWESALATWDPDDWAARFAATGARYVVLVTKHHDGYCLWPSDVTNPQVPGFQSARDVVGELADAVRAHDMRFGIYYSGGLDWTFNDHAIGTFADLLAAQPRGDYPAYAAAHVRELVARYHPSVLWNDISWPESASRLATLLGDYYAAVPEGVINDRFMCWSPTWALGKTRLAHGLIDRIVARNARNDKGLVPPKPKFYDVRTPEYTTFDDVQRTPWECVRGMDHSFGYNRMSTEADFITRADLLWSFVDIVAKGGNLLLNVGPRGEDATIPDEQLRRLEWLGELTGEHGDALFGTQPVPTGSEGEAGANDGDVRTTTRDDETFVFRRGTDGLPLRS